jgi:sialic acid synthase SpsE
MRVIITPSREVLMPIIAEVGQNFTSIKMATDMIKSAKASGASLVKFQLYDSLELYGVKQKTELSRGQAETLVQAGKDYGIPVFFSVFDKERLDWCRELGLEYYKIAYSQRNNVDLVSAIPPDARCFISCKNVNDHADPPCWVDHLFCIPCYPATHNMILFPEFDEYEGFSDHTVGLDVAKVAISRGAYWIEKHYCVDHNTGVDAAWSMTEAELRELVAFEKVAKSI